MDIKYGRGYVYSLEYHVVWCVKYRHKVIDDAIKEDLGAILRKIAQDNKFEILEYSTDLDHVHLLISLSPQHSIPNLMKAMKGVSARILMKKYGAILKSKLWGGHLWNPSYYIATVSDKTEQQIKRYIKEQGVNDESVQISDISDKGSKNLTA